MPRPNQARTIGSETTLAERIAFERKERGLTFEGLAQAMTDVGCPIDKSATYRIEKGKPRRTISVDELVALMTVFDLDFEDLMTPVSLIKQKQAAEVAKEMPGALAAFEDAVMHGLDVYLRYGRLAAGDPELLEFMNNQAGAIWDRGEYGGRSRGLDLGDNVTQDEIDDLQRQVIQTWGATLRLASKAAGAS